MDQHCWIIFMFLLALNCDGIHVHCLVLRQVYNVYKFCSKIGMALMAITCLSSVVCFYHFVSSNYLDTNKDQTACTQTKVKQHAFEIKLSDPKISVFVANYTTFSSWVMGNQSSICGVVCSLSILVESMYFCIESSEVHHSTVWGRCYVHMYVTE